MIQADKTSGLLATAPSAITDESFRQLVELHRHELTVHCYRLLGSLDDAEDALQETLLRAWRRLNSLKVQESLRAWLYKIATNVALDMLDSRKARSMPIVSYEPADPEQPVLSPVLDPVWLDPLPESYLDGIMLNPEARYETLESVSLAFLTTLQRLPGRQRAILILRDVLGWSAQEVSALLDITVVAVNSALQRARATLKKYPHDIVTSADLNDEQITHLLRRYVQAWENADSTSLIALLREDAALTMPPLPAWYRGRAAIKTFLDHWIFTEAAQWSARLIATRANGCPAFAVYQRDSSGLYRPSAIQVLTLTGDRIAQIDDFLTADDRLFSRFGLPPLG